MPTGKFARQTGFTQEAFEAAVMREAKKNNLSNQQQADIAVNEIIVAKLELFALSCTTTVGAPELMSITWSIAAAPLEVAAP